MDLERAPSAPRLASWAELERAAEDLATAIRRRFAANLHHVLGTVRLDGTPRLSGTEVAIADGEVRLGMMHGSRKLRDVRRDPRVELHSAPLERMLVEGDAKISGALIDDDVVHVDHPHGVFFRLAIRRASLVRVVDDELHVWSWSPDSGLEELRRR